MNFQSKFSHSVICYFENKIMMVSILFSRCESTKVDGAGGVRNTGEHVEDDN